MDESGVSTKILTYRKEQTETLNEMYKRLTELFNFQLNLGIYRLVMRGKVSAADVADAFDLSPQRVYSLVNKFKEDHGEIA